MKKIHILIFFILMSFQYFQGCQPNDTCTSSDTIVNKYFTIYKDISSIDTNTDNHDIAAILQTFTIDLIRNPSESWDDVQKREDIYMQVIRTNYISKVYTVQACKNEIIISDGFCDEILGYYSIIEVGYPYFAGNLLSESAIRFIILMDEYEYKKFRSNKDNR